MLFFDAAASDCALTNFFWRRLAFFLLLLCFFSKMQTKLDTEMTQCGKANPFHVVLVVLKFYLDSCLYPFYLGYPRITSGIPDPWILDDFSQNHVFPGFQEISDPEIRHMLLNR